MAGHEDEPTDVDFDEFDPAEMLIRTERSLGNGQFDDVRDVVYVRNDDIHAAETRAAAETVRELDQAIGAKGRRYLLIGPGRWGSSDPHLGVPVEWLGISHVRLIVETPLRGELLESSQGTHFFHNMTSARVGYLTVSPQANALLDRAWLDACPASRQTDLVRHVELDRPLRVHLDGRRGRAVVLKPEPNQGGSS